MKQEKRKRQSNRGYQERVHTESSQLNNGNNMEHFRIIPKQEEAPFGKQSASSEHSQQKKTSQQSRRSDQNQVQRSGQSNARKTQKKQTRPNQKKNTQKNNIQKNNSKKNSTKKNNRNTTIQKKSNIQKKSGQKRKEPKQQSVQRTPKQERIYFEYTLVFVVIFLVMFGLLMLYTASLYTTDFFVKQCVISLLGVAGLFIASFVDYHLYAKKPMIILIAAAAIIVVLLVKTPLGMELNGATRWIKIGPVSFQPAELFKIAVILVNAMLINRFSRRMSDWRILSMFAAMAILEFLYIYLVTENLSSAIIVAMITMLMVFVAYPGYKLFLALGAAGAGLAALVIYYVLNAGADGGFRSGRIIAWLAPERLADQKLVFQTNQALYAIGSGGLWGKGLGAGKQKMHLPEAMNDTIFAIICEELGMVGASLVLIMFAILLYRIMFIAQNSKDLLGGMVATGIFAHFMLQVILNVGVVTNLLPSTGVTLPFISYGGSALVLLMAEIGVALNISRQIDFEGPQLVKRKVKK